MRARKAYAKICRGLDVPVPWDHLAPPIRDVIAALTQGRRRTAQWGGLVAAGAFFVGACTAAVGAEQDTTTPMASARPTVTHTATRTATATVTPTRTSTRAPTRTHRKTSTAAATAPRPVTRKPETLPPAPAPSPAADDKCDPNYSGCVPIASDVDCAGGSGNGPAYLSGTARVVGSDIYRLDRDHDGIACN